MATEKQVAANRRDAEKSTGPRTVGGKEKSRLNAVKSGLSSPSGVAVLPTESQEEFEAFHDALLADLKPVGALQEELATGFIEDSWRLRRPPKIERGILAHGVADVEKRYLLGLKPALRAVGRDVPGAKAAAFFRDPETVVENGGEELLDHAKTVDENGGEELLDHAKTVVENGGEELLEYAKGLFAEALDAKRSDEARLASGFIEDAAGPNALPKLSRYETALLRRRDQKLAMLKALQSQQSE